MADYPTKQFLGSAQTVINTAVDVASGAFSATTTNFVNNDATYPNAPYALAMGEFPDWAAAPVAGTVVELWGLLFNTDGTDDDTQPPSSSASGGVRYFGAWPISADDALQRRTIVISLEGIIGSMEVAFYFRNVTAQNMNNDGGTNAVVKITPFTYGITV